MKPYFVVRPTPSGHYWIWTYIEKVGAIPLACSHGSFASREEAERDIRRFVDSWDKSRICIETHNAPPEENEASFRSETKPSPLDAAKRSLAEAERLEGRAFETKLDHHAAPIEGMRDELLLGILQSNIAIAEALNRDQQPDEDLCDEECACDEEPGSLEHVLDAIDTRLRRLEMGAVDEAVARALRCQTRTARRGLIRDEGLS